MWECYNMNQVDCLERQKVHAQVIQSYRNQMQYYDSKYTTVYINLKVPSRTWFIIRHERVCIVSLDRNVRTASGAIHNTLEDETQSWTTLLTVYPHVCARLCKNACSRVCFLSVWTLPISLQTVLSQVERHEFHSCSIDWLIAGHGICLTLQISILGGRSCEPGAEGPTIGLWGLSRGLTGRVLRLDHVELEEPMQLSGGLQAQSCNVPAGRNLPLRSLHWDFLPIKTWLSQAASAILSTGDCDKSRCGFEGACKLSTCWKGLQHKRWELSPCHFLPHIDITMIASPVRAE